MSFLEGLIRIISTLIAILPIIIKFTLFYLLSTLRKFLKQSRKLEVKNPRKDILYFTHGQIFGEAGYPAGGECGRRRGRGLRAGKQTRKIYLGL